MFHPQDAASVQKEIENLKSMYHEQNEIIMGFSLSVASLERNTFGLKTKIEELHLGFKGFEVPGIPWKSQTRGRVGAKSVMKK